MADLNETDTKKLFDEVSKSIRDNDTLKLDELIDVKPDEGNPEEDLDDSPADEEQPDEVEAPQDEPAEDEEQDTPPPGDEPAEKQSEKKDEGSPDELATLREQLENIKKENHRLKSQAGRVPHLQSRIKEFDRRLDELNKQLNSPSSQPSTKIAPELQKIVAKIRETDPELADAMEATARTASDGVARELLTSQIASIEAARKEEYEAYHRAEYQRLIESVPNAPDIFADKHWTEWKSSQTKVWQDLASSDNADDVIFAIKKYTEDMIAKYPELAPKEEQQTPPAAQSPDPEAAKKAAEVEAARQRRKDKAVVTNSPTPAGQVSTPSDAAALFKKYSEEIRKTRLGE